MFRLLDEIAAAYGLFGKVREREGSGSFVAVPHGHFRTKDGKWIAIACTTDKMFERLAVAMERPELASATAVRRAAQAAGGARRGQPRSSSSGSARSTATR